VCYHIFECIGKLDAEAFLHDPRLIESSRDIPNVNRCMCPIVDWTVSLCEKVKCIVNMSLLGRMCVLIVFGRLGV
jgi:hypothetical protein